MPNKSFEKNAIDGVTQAGRAGLMCSRAVSSWNLNYIFEIVSLANVWLDMPLCHLS
jgi:hypothetical protein